MTFWTSSLCWIHCYTMISEVRVSEPGRGERMVVLELGRLLIVLTLWFHASQHWTWNSHADSILSCKIKENLKFWFLQQFMSHSYRPFNVQRWHYNVYKLILFSPGRGNWTVYPWRLVPDSRLFSWGLLLCVRWFWSPHLRYRGSRSFPWVWRDIWRPLYMPQVSVRTSHDIWNLIDFLALANILCYQSYKIKGFSVG